MHCRGSRTKGRHVAITAGAGVLPVLASLVLLAFPTLAAATPAGSAIGAQAAHATAARVGATSIVVVIFAPLARHLP